jgi:hypothetical protein
MMWGTVHAAGCIPPIFAASGVVHAALGCCTLYVAHCTLHAAQYKLHLRKCGVCYRNAGVGIAGCLLHLAISAPFLEFEFGMPVGATPCLVVPACLELRAYYGRTVAAFVSSDPRSLKSLLHGVDRMVDFEAITWHVACCIVSKGCIELLFWCMPALGWCTHRSCSVQRAVCVPMCVAGCFCCIYCVA